MGGHLLCWGRTVVLCYLGLFWDILRFGLRLRQMLGSTTVLWIWISFLTFSFKLAYFAITSSLSVQLSTQLDHECLLSLKYFSDLLIQQTTFFQSSFTAKQTCTYRQWKKYSNNNIIIRF